MKNILIALLLTGIQVISLTAATTLNFSNSLMSVDGNGNPVVNIILPLETNLPNLNVSGGVSVQNPAGTNRILGTTIISTNTALEQPQYIDLVANGQSLGTGGGAPTFTTIAGRLTGYMCYDTTDFSYGNLQMPHNIATTNAAYPNLVIHMHIHWCVTNNLTVAGNSNVTWSLNWVYTPIDGTNSMSGSNSVTTMVQGVQTNAGYHILTELVEITNNAATISGDLSFRIGRIVTPTFGADVAQKVALMFIDAHIPIGNKTLLGSRQELSQ